MIKRIQTQQKLTNSQGIVKLNLEDEVIEHAPVQEIAKTHIPEKH